MKGVEMKRLFALFSALLPIFELKWPDTSPIDKSDPYGELNNNLSLNGIPYHKVEVLPGKWQYQVNEKIQQMKWQQQRDKDQLYSDLRTRVLTDEEFERAKSFGLSLVTREMVPYYEQEKRRELDDGFLQQARLRAVIGK